MRFNEKGLIYVASAAADKEGRITFKSPGFRETYKERWFKLKGNLLFYFRLNEHGAVFEKEPVGVLVMENFRVQEEPYTEYPNTFSVTFASEIDKRYYFSCQSARHRDEWMNALKECSYEFQRAKLMTLRDKIMQATEKDPLDAFSGRKYRAIEETDSDVYFSKIPVSKAASASQDFFTA